jgi:hypothetical protein
VENLIAEGQADIKIDYRTRDQLPIEVRPVGGDPRREVYTDFEDELKRKKIVE